MSVCWFMNVHVSAHCRDAHDHIFCHELVSKGWVFAHQSVTSFRRVCSSGTNINLMSGQLSNAVSMLVDTSAGPLFLFLGCQYQADPGESRGIRALRWHIWELHCKHPLVANSNPTCCKWFLEDWWRKEENRKRWFSWKSVCQAVTMTWLWILSTHQKSGLVAHACHLNSGRGWRHPSPTKSWTLNLIRDPVSKKKIERD